MDIATMGLMAGLVAIALAILAVIIAYLRKAGSSTIYASGFVSGAVGYILLLGQGRLSPWLSVVLANALIFWLQLSLSWGLRVKVEVDKPFPPRFWAYLGALFAVMIGGFHSFPIRAVGMSVLVSAAAIEFARSVGRGRRALSSPLRMVTWALVGLYLAGQGVLFFLAVGGLSSGAFFLDNRAFSIFSLLLVTFFMIVWAGLVLAIDATALLDELERQNRALADLAVTDRLTGLFNRHLLDANIDAEMGRAGRYGESLSLILFDLDHFKRVNDSYGHQVGDEVLKKVASMARRLVRKSDQLYRWGGEEFLIVSPNTTMEGARSLAEKIRAGIGGAFFPGPGSMTASFGVAAWAGTGEKEEWFRRVDLALYRAKNCGRNRVEGIGPGEDISGAIFRVEWREEWASGDATIDGQHRSLLELCNALLGLSLARAPAEEISAVLSRLIEETRVHFQTEEEMLRERGWQGLEAHAALHRDLLSTATLMGEAAAREAIASSDYFNFLVDELIMGHLLKEDVTFFELFKGTPA